jgi:hypothetical protein
MQAELPAYVIVEERATPGLNLTWMLNACWIFPVHEDQRTNAGVLDAALESIVSRPPQSATGDRFLNLPVGLDKAALESWGFAKEATLHMYALTRAGVHRYLGYAAGRYGELDALRLRRARRRGSE